MADYKTLQEDLLANEKLFEDEEFPATEDSLGFGSDEFVWKRPKEICESIDSSLEPEFFVDGRSKKDVRQGKRISNCWVVSAVVCLSTAKQEVFDRVVPRNQGFSVGQYCGAFQFNFWHFGKWKNVIVDDRLPTDCNSGKLAFIYSTSPNEFWGALLEKAYAKLHGSYQHLEIGYAADALTDFTGGLVEHYVLESGTECPNVCSLLKDAFHTHSMAAVETQGEDGVKIILDNGIIVNHAYSMTGIKDVDLTDDDKMVTCSLVNPWGDGTIWRGDCTDGCSSEREKIIRELNTETLGEFWIEVEDVVKNFHRIVLCSRYDESSWTTKTVYGSWETDVNSGGDRVDSDFATNPQLIINADSSDSATKMIVELTQVGRRYQGLENLKLCLYAFEVTSSTDAPLTSEFLDEAKPMSGLRDTVDDHFNRRSIVERFEFQPNIPIAFIFGTSQPGDQGRFMGNSDE